MNIGQRIRNRRIELGLTQDEVAQKTGYKSRSSINKIECSRNLPLTKVEKMASALECSPSYLMGWEDEEIEKQAKMDVRMFQYTSMIEPDSELGKLLGEKIDIELSKPFNEKYELVFKYIEKIYKLTDKQREIIFGMVDEMSIKKEGKE